MLISKFSTQTLLLLLALFSTFATGYRYYDCYQTLKKRCCFHPDGNVLRHAVQEYLQHGSASYVAHKFGAVIGDWCVDYVESFSFVFKNQIAFNEPLTYWTTSSARNMSGMFHGAGSF
jgi:hypothetical protein